ncbi:MAG: hypothetical protein AAFV07_16580, partial [Bacteroidota bacterium]
ALLVGQDVSFGMKRRGKIFIGNYLISEFLKTYTLANIYDPILQKPHLSRPNLLTNCVRP